MRLPLGILGAIFLSVVLAWSTSDGASEVSFSIMPMYTTNATSWQRLYDTKSKYKNMTVYVVGVDISNPPGSQGYNDTLKHYERFRAIGVNFLAYTHTRTKDWQGKRPSNEIEDDIDRYALYFPNHISGIFFDNTDVNIPEYVNTTKELVQYYRNQTDYAHKKGFKFTVGNAAKNVHEEFVNCFDTILIYERGHEWPQRKEYADWHAKYPKQKWGIIPWDIPSLNLTALRDTKKYVKYIHLYENSPVGIPPNFEQLFYYLTNDF